MSSSCIVWHHRLALPAMGMELYVNSFLAWISGCSLMSDMKFIKVIVNGLIVLNVFIERSFCDTHPHPSTYTHSTHRKVRRQASYTARKRQLVFPSPSIMHYPRITAKSRRVKHQVRHGLIESILIDINFFYSSGNVSAGWAEAFPEEQN